MQEQHRRICSRTGLALVSSPEQAFRIARESYGPLAPLARSNDENREAWSRYDTAGRTIYAAADELTAYMEMLAPYRTIIENERRALQPVADFLERSLDDVWTDIVNEWDEAGNMKASWLPRSFREGRAMFTLALPAGWWIDVTATETISTLHDFFDFSWPTSSGPLSGTLTLSHLTGDDRTLTTSIAALLRQDVILDDDSRPLGIEFPSKHGHPAGSSGTCWAYWMREATPEHPETTTVTAVAPILASDPAFIAAQAHCKIRSR